MPTFQIFCSGASVGVSIKRPSEPLLKPGLLKHEATIARAERRKNRANEKQKINLNSANLFS